MSVRLKLKQWEISMLEWTVANMQEDPVYISYMRKWIHTGLGPEAYSESAHRWARKKLVRDRRRLSQHLAYLKRQHYLEHQEESDHMLHRLTASGKFELLRLRFILHMHDQYNKKWNGKFYLIVFDFPEEKRKYRDFFRKLLKANGFQFLQLSVWMSRHNPRPAIEALVAHLKLAPYFELMEINGECCSAQLRKKIQ